MSGTFTAVDTNVLIYAHNRRSEWHDSARSKIEFLASGAQPWAIPWPCIHEFLAITTNPRIFSASDTIAAALEQVAIWMESPSLRLIGEMRGHWHELQRILTEAHLSGGAIHDARIAAICLEHGITELWSADRDFARIQRLKVRNPLV